MLLPPPIAVSRLSDLAKNLVGHERLEALRRVNGDAPTSDKQCAPTQAIQSPHFAGRHVSERSSQYSSGCRMNEKVG
jgi:hypothetical protein